MDKITIFRIIFAAIIVALVLIVLSGCKSVPPIIAPITHESWVERTETRVDTFWRDRWHTEKIKGDTIYVHDSIYLEKIKYRDRVDSIYVNDSIPYPVEVTVPVRERNGYDKFTARGFWIYTGILIVGMVVLFIRWRIKRRL